jgi:hypothetical protein
MQMATRVACQSRMLRQLDQLDIAMMKLSPIERKSCRMWGLNPWLLVYKTTARPLSQSGTSNNNDIRCLFALYRTDCRELVYRTQQDAMPRLISPQSSQGTAPTAAPDRPPNVRDAPLRRSGAARARRRFKRQVRLFSQR